jgi:ATP-binding protein involved in chromosome partitioning
MSIVYFTEDKPAPFRGIDISNIIIELLAITQWGSLDYLIIDMPPGIGDETLDVIRLVKKSEFLVISAPSRVVMGAVRKLFKILKELKIPVLGVIENMSMTKSSFGRAEVCEMKLKFLGSIHFDKNLEDSIGYPEKLMETSFMKDFDKIVKNIIL